MASSSLTTGQPSVVVNAATVTGTAKAIQFSVPPSLDNKFKSILFIPSSDGTVTTLTVTLEVSNDGGTTWIAYPSGAGLNFNSLATVIVSNVMPGVLYRLNITAITLGTGTFVTMNASAA